MNAGYSSVVRHVSRTLVRIWATVWLRFSIEGRANVPRRGAVLLVANHASYLDPPLLGIATSRLVRFLAQAGLARFRPMRWWLRNVGVSLIDRGAPSKDVLRYLADSLAQGVCVALFPEGTRSPDGSVGAFRSGVEFLVRRTGASVVPVGIEGTHRAFPRGARFPRPKKCCVRFGAVWPAARVLAAGGSAALRAEIAVLARAPLRAPAPDPRVGQGPGTVPADPSSFAGGGA